jgi:hypothetical protein
MNTVNTTTQSAAVSVAQIASKGERWLHTIRGNLRIWNFRYQSRINKTWSVPY